LLSQTAPQDLPRPTKQAAISIGIDVPLKPRRIAVADFRQASKLGSASPEALTKVFNDVLWSDLDNSGLFEMVSKSFYPKDIPGRGEDMSADKISAWAQPPTNTEAVAFGTLSTTGDRMLIEGFLFDVTPASKQKPMVVAMRYGDEALPEAARVIAHRFANEIILRLGGASGIGESKIFFSSTRSGAKEIWSMDYDGANQHQITHYNKLAMSPAISPDGSKLAFMLNNGTQNIIQLLSLDTNRLLSFSNQRGLNATPAWSPDGNQIAMSSSFTDDPEIYIGDMNGGNRKRLTFSPGIDTSPAINPKTGQIAFISSRQSAGSVPALYIMDGDGKNVRRLSGAGGDAVTPAWAPNGQLLAFSWTRGYAPGNYNIFVMDVSNGNLLQLTHGAGANEHPSWAPDGRHIVFESNRAGGRRKQIYTMLADGTQVRALTSAGENTTPVWSAR
jgi:TolB protein